jgi:hypothetical protein
MKFELKSIGYWPLIKVSFIINLIVGFILGLFFALFIGAMLSIMNEIGGMPGMPMYSDEMPPLGFMLILYPFMFAIFGAVFYTILCLVIAFIYNMIAKVVGGLEFNLNEIRLQPVTYTAPQPAYYQPPQQTPPPPAQPPSSPPTPPPPPPPPPPVEPLPPDITPPDNRPDDKEQL